MQHCLRGTEDVAADLGMTRRWVQNTAAREGIGSLVGRRTRVFSEADVARLQEMRKKPGWEPGRKRKPAPA